jgi:nicotinamidase-related amidase
VSRALIVVDIQRDYFPGAAFLAALADGYADVVSSDDLLATRA